MKKLKDKKKEVVSQEELIQQKKEKTAQQWIPIADIEGPVVYRKDNLLIAMLRVLPENLDLLSDKEKKRRVDALAEQLNGETEDSQIFCIGRPVDLNNYLDWLQDKAKMEQDFTRKTVLKGYIQQASQMASNGETTERRFYFVIWKQAGDKAEIDLLNRINDLQIKLSQAELITSICHEDELIDLYSLFVNPVQAGFERPELQLALPPLLV